MFYTWKCLSQVRKITFVCYSFDVFEHSIFPFDKGHSVLNFSMSYVEKWQDESLIFGCELNICHCLSALITNSFISLTFYVNKLETLLRSGSQHRVVFSIILLYQYDLVDLRFTPVGKETLAPPTFKLRHFDWKCAPPSLTIA